MSTLKKSPIDQFRRALAVFDALPHGFRPADEVPLRDILPGGWPTFGDLRKLVESYEEKKSGGEK